MRLTLSSFLRLCVMIFAGSLCLADVSPALQPAEPAGGKRALLIGINKYKAVPKLQGSLNDIATMKQILLTRWGFPEENIRLLVDEEATRTGMLAALDRFVQETGPDDTVYVHYSGHGSQVEDLNNDEPDDHLDETLVPQDGRSGNVRDITDDELNVIFSRMRAKRALIVLDSCHSGTATRSLDIRTRSIPPDSRVELYRKALKANPQTRGVVPVVTSRYVLMTGAASHQEALDGPVEGRYHGFFTYSLAKSLGSSSPDASPREIFSGVEQELRRIQTHFGRSSMPEPQLEAPPELIDSALMGPAASSAKASQNMNRPRLPWLDVIAGAGGTVTFANGTLLGGSPGSIWSIYPPGETHFFPGRALAVATVTQVRGKDSVAKVHSNAVQILSGSRAVSLLPAPTDQRVPIRILDVPPNRHAVIEETLRKNVRNLDLVGPEQPARFSVDLQGEQLRLLAADGLQEVASFGLNEPWGAGIASVVSRAANTTELLTLDNPSSQLKVDVRVATASKPKVKVSTRGIAVVADTKPAKYRIRKQGKPRTEQNSLQLEVRVNADSYVTIVDVDSAGGVNVLFPNPHQQQSFYADGFMKADKPALIPDSIKPGNKAGFYWDYSPPKGTDTIRVFSTSDLETASMLREHIRSVQASASESGDKPNTRSIADAVKSLRTLLAGIAARGIITVADDTSHIPGQVSGTGDQTMPVTVEPLATPEELPYQEISPSTLDSSNASTSLVGSTPVQGDWAATSLTITVSE